MRIVIAGAGQVGTSIAASLCDEHDVVVIDVDRERVDELTYSIDVLALHGDAADPEMLREADVADAELLIASTDDDEVNLAVCGTADALTDCFTIARVRTPKYLGTWDEAVGAFGVDFMVCTDLLTAQHVVQIIGLPTARDIGMFADGAVEMASFDVPAESPVAGQTVREADRFEDLTFAALFHEDALTVPRGDTVIAGGDDVVVIGTPESVEAFGREIEPGHDVPDDIVVLGGGEIGYQTARLLEARGYGPRLIERDEDRARWLAERLPDTRVMQDDATDQEFLDRERVGEADTVIATLDSDHRNLLATLLAQRLGAARTIAVVAQQDFAELFEAVGVDVAVSPRELTAEEITRFTRERRTENVSMVGHDEGEVVEVEVRDDGDAVGERVADLDARLPEDVVFGAITRNGSFVAPRGDTVLEAGDHVVVYADVDAVDAVTEML